MITAHPVILFDGVCNFCNGAVNFLIRRDKNAGLRFAPLQSAFGQSLLKQHNLPIQTFASFVLIIDGKTFQKSTAALRLLPYLPWYWQWANVFWIVPLFIRDRFYDYIARNRYRWFGRKKTCMIPDASIRSRFLA